MTARGLYIYCVEKGYREEPLDLCGIEGTPVWALTDQGLVAIVQECEPKPFASADQIVFANWLLIHQNIVDLAWERYETIIPFGFGTVILPTNGNSARQNLNEWLEKESAEITRKLEYLQNKAEYGVQVLWDPNVILPRIREQDAEIPQSEEVSISRPPAVSYLFPRTLEEL